jgi:hypothetical protein
VLPWVVLVPFVPWIVPMILQADEPAPLPVAKSPADAQPPQLPNEAQVMRVKLQRSQVLLQALTMDAARDRFPAVHFAPPRFQQLPVARSAVPQMAASQASGSFRWLAWAIAAAIWLTGPLLLLTWESHRQRIQTAHHDWQTNRQTLTELESQLHYLYEGYPGDEL